MFLFDTKKLQKKTRRNKLKSANLAEAKAAAKAKKIQQDDMNALQITFYEIESWIEKTTPTLNRMTKDLDKVSKHFKTNKRKKTDSILHKKDIPTTMSRSTAHSIATPLPVIESNASLSSFVLNDTPALSSMQWALSFQPGNSMRIDTNIKSIEQLIDAVQKMRLMTESNTNLPDLCSDDESEDNSSATSVVDPSIEYWQHAMYRRPHTCLEKYKHCDMNLSHLTQDISPSVLRYICQTYWDCLHPKFAADWSVFWNRSSDSERNQICIDSGLAMIFFHIVRHNRNACANAHAIAYYYYDRARETLCFDEPDVTTIETLLNLSLFCVLCKRHSQSRIYLSLAYRMIHQLGLGNKSQLPTNVIQQKALLNMHMVLYYNDVIVSVYSGEPSLIDDSIYDIDFYQMLDYATDQETFFVHLVELTRIGKCIQLLAQDYQRQNLQHHHKGTLPFKWIKQIQSLEVSLAQWFGRLPPFHHTQDTQASLLLMMQYQTEWIRLHKTFLSPNHQQAVSDLDGISPLATTPYRTDRSYNICTDAANRIVAMAETINQKYDWCVCQQFISCVYQASTVFCKSILNKDKNNASSKSMIKRIMKVLAASKVNYEGLPDDLTACLMEFLADNDTTNTAEILATQYAIKQNDTMFNSPRMFEQCLKQQVAVKPSTLNRGPPSEAMLSIKIQNPNVATLDIEPTNKNWRCKFSSSNIAQADQRIV